jgi:2-polyprenyl-3-methyl-5-hydroxy-6-metoxy-1,4-benzoquinol methylase
MRTVKKILRNLGTATRLHLLSQAIRDWMQGPPDGLPIPPAEMRHLVSGDPSHSRSSFFDMGSHCARRIVEALKKTDVDIDSFDAILDFGCGCGRTIRHLRSLRKAKLYGTDYNLKLIDWCDRNLPFGRFRMNQLHPPLVYPGEAFDLVYAFSVFTHLPESLQFSWMKELSRVLKPRGYLVISTLPLGMLAEGQRTGQMVVCNESEAGANACLAYHAFDYVVEKLAKGFEVVEFKGGGGQDFYLLRKLTDGGTTHSGA